MANTRETKRTDGETAVLMIEDIIQEHQRNYLTISSMVQTVVSNSDYALEDEPRASYSMTRKMSAQVEHMNRLTKVTDVD